MVAFHETVRQPEDGYQNLHDKQACRRTKYFNIIARCLLLRVHVLQNHEGWSEARVECAPSVLIKSWGSIIICTRPKMGYSDGCIRILAGLATQPHDYREASFRSCPVEIGLLLRRPGA